MRDGHENSRRYRDSRIVGHCRRRCNAEMDTTTSRNPSKRKAVVDDAGNLHVTDANETPNVSMLITPTISCWEAGRWELYTKRQNGKMAQAQFECERGMSSELWRLSASQVARLIRTRKVSAREVADAALQRLDSVNPRITAIVDCRPDLVREQADRVDSLLARGNDPGP